MHKKKPADRGVVDSIAALRLMRYLEKGPGAKPARQTTRPSVDQLRSDVATVVKKAAKKKPKRRNRR